MEDGIKPKWNKKLVLLIVVVALLLLGDFALIIGDQFFGEEKGRIFGYKVFDLIIESNIKAILLIVILYLVFILIKYLRKVLKKLPKISIKRPKPAKNNLEKPAPADTASKKKASLLQNIIIPIFSLLVLIILIELVFFVILKIKNNTNAPYAAEIFAKEFYQKDSIMGMKAKNNLVTRCKKVLIDPSKQDTSSIFDVTYTTDSLGNRFIDIPGMQNRKKYALFFGCSFTFGIGVQDQQTIPYYFAKNDTGYCAYNFGFTGYGPQNMLAKFKQNSLKMSVKQDSGACFYIYINSHVARAIGDMVIYTSYGKDLPYFDYKNDSLHYFGSFSKNRKFISGFYSLMSKSNFIKYFKINFPPVQVAKHYKLTCDIIYQSYLEYKKQFHNDNFYVVLYPSHDDIKEYLKKYNIKIIDISKIFNMSNELYYLSVYDRHPTALANKLATEQLLNAFTNSNTKK